MKLFFYKSVLVLVLFVIGVHFSFFLIKDNLKRDYDKLISKENVENIKNKIREELKDGVEKEVLINPEDAILLKKFFEKINKDIYK